MTYANRGKYAERLLASHMGELSNSRSSAFQRLADAHAGSMTATLCDFLFIRSGVLHLVECKSTKHAYRLPYGNVDAAQIAKMRLWKFAGARAFVMIYHEGLGLWRTEDVDFFVDRSVGGSWDMRPRDEAGDLASVFQKALTRGADGTYCTK